MARHDRHEHGRALDPLKVWSTGNVLLDGHNRLGICKSHDLPYAVEYLDFESEEAATNWAVNNQLGRRNVTDAQRTKLMGLLYRENSSGHGGDRRSSSGNGCHLKEQEGNRTAAKIAKQFKVNEKTVRNAAKFVDDLEAISKVDEELEAEILTSPSPPKRKDIRRAAEAVKQGESPRAVLEAAQKAKGERQERRQPRTSCARLPNPTDDLCSCGDEHRDWTNRQDDPYGPQPCVGMRPRFELVRVLQ